jgi:hypothetical protein
VEPAGVSLDLGAIAHVELAAERQVVHEAADIAHGHIGLRAVADETAAIDLALVGPGRHSAGAVAGDRTGGGLAGPLVGKRAAHRGPAGLVGHGEGAGEFIVEFAAHRSHDRVDAFHRHRAQLAIGIEHAEGLVVEPVDA